MMCLNIITLDMSLFIMYNDRPILASAPLQISDYDKIKDPLS